MTTPERRAEASQVSLVFHAAMTSLGFKTLAESIQLWADVSANPKQLASSSGRWITFALSLVDKRRAHVRQLAISYYRLVRALHTGFTIDDPLAPKGEQHVTHIPLGDLRNAFLDDVDTLAPEVLRAEPAVDSTDANEIAEIEEILGLIEELEQQQNLSEEEARTVLEALGPKNLEDKLKTIGDDKSSKEVDQLRETAHREAGLRQAAAAERIVMNGGRGGLFALADKDPRVIGYARVSRTGTPCGWCAMLISRGVVYGSEKSGTFKGDGDLYHDNCHCFAEPVFSQEQYDEDPKFNLNREYDALWPKVTKGLRGKAALSAWRRYFRANRD